MSSKTNLRRWLSVFVFGFICAVLGFFLCMADKDTVLAEESEERFYALAFHEYLIEDYTEGVTVRDPLGQEVEIADGGFTPMQAGEYSIRYPSYSRVLEVFLSVPVSNYDFTFELDSEYSVGEMIELPEAAITSAVEDGAEYTVFIEKDGSVAETILYGNELVYQPLATGNYSVVYSYIDRFGYISNKSFDFVVTDEPAISFRAPERFSYGQSIDVGVVYAYAGDERVTAVSKIYDPQGSEVDITSGSFTADVIGTYRWEISAEVGGASLKESYEIPCDIYTGDLFVPVRMGNDPVEQFELPDVCMKTGKGVLLEATTTGAVYQYSQPVNLNDITSDENILTFFPYCTDEIGYTEDLTVRFTDVYDKFNSISLQFKCSPFHDSLTYVTAEYSGRHYAYDNENFILTGVDGPVKIGDQYFFGGLMPDHWSMRMDPGDKAGNKLDVYSFSMNYAERQIILDITSSSQPLNRYVLADLDNALWIGGEQYAWHGFTTGEAYMTIEFGTIQGRSASVIVTEVMGQKLDASVMEDTVAPSLLFDTEEPMQDPMPYGIVGKDYVIPSARALDSVGGALPVKTILKQGDEPIEFSDGRFTPAEAGIYTLVYTAVDQRGNPREETFTFTVYDEAEAPAIELEISDYEKPVTGQYFTVPEITVRGASGKTTLETTVLYNDVECVPDAAGKIFIDKVGKLVVSAKAEDWMGRTAEKQFEIPIDTDTISFVIPERHGVAQVGRELYFADAIVNDFVKDENTEIVQKIFVNDVELTDNTYAVKDADTVLVVRYEVTAGNASGETTYEIPVVSAASDTRVADLFRTEAAVRVGGSNNDEIWFDFESDANVAFVNPVAHNQLRVSIAVSQFQIAAPNEFYVDLHLTDMAYGRESIFIRVIPYNTTHVKLQLNGQGDVVIHPGSFSQNVPITFVYDCEKQIIKHAATEKELFALDRCENGDVFSGFTSGAVWFNMDVKGMQQNDKLSLRLANLSNESFYNYVSMGDDFIRPVVSLPTDNEIVECGINTEYVIEPTKAYDVLQGVFDVKTTIILPNGTTVLSEEVLSENYVLSLTEYGRYTVIYETVDSQFTVQGTRELFIDVNDTVAPEISLKGEMPASATLGDVWNVVGANVTDNLTGSVTVTILIYDPNARNTIVQEGDSYRFVLRGDHKIVYVATDEAGNTARIIRHIEVV